MEDNTMPQQESEKILRARIENLEGQSARVHDLLDGIGVPRVVSEGGTQNDVAADRLIWLIRDSIGAQCHDEMAQRQSVLEDAADKLKKMVAAYEANNGPDPGTQTTPWMIVRWAREHLR